MPPTTFDGKPCKNCGGATRYEKNHLCVLCDKRRHHEYNLRKAENKVKDVKPCRYCKTRFKPVHKNQIQCGSDVCKKAWASEHYVKHKKTVGQEREAANPELYSARRIERNRRVRLECLQHIGGLETPQCACCGEATFEFLTIDHVNNDGAEHRRDGVGSTSLMCWLKRNNWPDGFQVLCWNCNDGKERNGGTCPHINI